MYSGAAVNVVTVGGPGGECSVYRGFIFPVPASFILIQTNDFALDSRQEPYEVMLHVRICAGGRRQRRSLPRSTLTESVRRFCTKRACPPGEIDLDDVLSVPAAFSEDYDCTRACPQ